MRALLAVIVCAILGWCAYWFISANAAKGGFETWFEERRSEGWQAEYRDLGIIGFPNRLDATFEELELADPETGLAWSAPFFQLLALSYRPTHVIAVWPEQQTFSTLAQTFEITSEQMRASVIADPTPGLPLLRANFSTEAPAIRASDGTRVQAETVKIALRRAEAEATLYDIAYQAEGVTPPSNLRSDMLPATLSAMDLDMSVAFDRPWDMRALEERRPQPTSIDLRLAKAEWGTLLVQAAAELEIDVTGTPSGELSLRVKNWRDLVRLARESGAVAPVTIDASEQIMALLARLSGSPEDIDTRIRFSGGTMFVGIIPVGPAPKLQLR